MDGALAELVQNGPVKNFLGGEQSNPVQDRAGRDS